MSAADGNFGNLYRSALGERNPHHKALLLRRVTEIISEWERQSRALYEPITRSEGAQASTPINALNPQGD